LLSPQKASKSLAYFTVWPESLLCSLEMEKKEKERLARTLATTVVVFIFGGLRSRRRRRMA
jgi:hypothetical protein